MTSDAETLAAAHMNYIASYRKIAEHSPTGEVRPVGKVFAFSTGWPIALFNGCVIVEPAAQADLDAALTWVSERRRPYQVAIVEELLPGLQDTLLAHGLRRHMTSPGMVLHPVPEPPDPPPGVSVAAGAEGGLATLPPSFVNDPDVRVFTASLDGRPVGTSTAIRSGDVSGVYGVGTLPEARRRGVGTAASWAAVGAGRAWGCRTVVLQATDVGLPVYVKMGFRTIVFYAIYRTQPAAG